MLPGAVAQTLEVVVEPFNARHTLARRLDVAEGEHVSEVARVDVLLARRRRVEVEVAVEVTRRLQDLRDVRRTRLHLPHDLRDVARARLVERENLLLLSAVLGLGERELVGTSRRLVRALPGRGLFARRLKLFGVVQLERERLHLFENLFGRHLLSPPWTVREGARLPWHLVGRRASAAPRRCEKGERLSRTSRTIKRLRTASGVPLSRRRLARAAHLEGLLALEALEVVDEARSGALGKLLGADAHHRLALLVRVNAGLARERADHAELLRRHEVGHRLGERVFRKVARLRARALRLDDLGLALVEFARDAELDGRALQGVVLGLLDAGLVVGGAGADALAGDSVNRDGTGDGDHVANLDDAANRVRPGRRDAVEDVRDRVPLDVLDHVLVAVAVAPALARLDEARVNRLLQSAQGLGERERDDLRARLLPGVLLGGDELLLVCVFRNVCGLLPCHFKLLFVVRERTLLGLDGDRLVFRRRDLRLLVLLPCEARRFTRCSQVSLRGSLAELLGCGLCVGVGRLRRNVLLALRVRGGGSDGRLLGSGLRVLVQNRVLDGEDVLATVARVCGRLLLELEAGAANPAGLVAPDFIARAASPKGRRGDAEAVALAVHKPHRGDPLRALVAHQSFLVENGCHDLKSSVKPQNLFQAAFSAGICAD